MAAPRKLPKAVVAALVVLLLLGVYGGSYWLSMDDTLVDQVEWGKQLTVVPSEDYRVGGEAAAWFFWPARQADKAIRPKHWEGEVQ